MFAIALELLPFFLPSVLTPAPPKPALRASRETLTAFLAGLDISNNAFAFFFLPATSNRSDCASFDWRLLGFAGPVFNFAAFVGLPAALTAPGFNPFGFANTPFWPVASIVFVLPANARAVR